MESLYFPQYNFYKNISLNTHSEIFLFEKQKNIHIHGMYCFNFCRILNTVLVIDYHRSKAFSCIFQTNTYTTKNNEFFFVSFWGVFELCHNKSLKKVKLVETFSVLHRIMLSHVNVKVLLFCLNFEILKFHYHYSSLYYY